MGKHVSSFIIDHLDEILVEWEAFARTLSPDMGTLALRDHARQMLETIARDIESSQTDDQQARKSKGLAPGLPGVSAAEKHGELRHTVGFDLQSLVSEFRALRATVLRLWIEKKRYGDAQAAYEMARFNEGIDQALAESVESYSLELAKSRETFLAILGHDLRSPLGALSGALHVMSMPAATPTQRVEALASGRRSVAFMGSMIRDLLEYTRTRLGKGIPIAPAPADLDSVCRAAIDEASLAYPGCVFQLDSEGPVRAEFDPERMHQVVANLLNNAVQHGRRDAPIRVLARAAEAHVRLEVANQGRPIPPSLLEMIFEPLVQADVTGAPLPPSTNMGLGLHIASVIVRAHHGTIVASSSAEAGTRFTIELPSARSRVREDATA